jgi:hypothetical protein
MSDENQTSTTRITRKKVAKRNDVTVRTVMRWEIDPKLGFPKPFIINGRAYFDDAELRAWEISRDRKVA